MPKPVYLPADPYWATRDGETVRLYHGHVLDRLKDLADGSVHCVVTSPPYWGLRDYGTDKTLEIGSEPSPDCGTHGQAQCGRCFVCSMVAAFRGVRRVLRDDGTVWLNLGDSYSSGNTDRLFRPDFDERAVDDGQRRTTTRTLRGGFADGGHRPTPQSGLPSGNLVGVPWRVALALQADGWVLRQDIIWHKPSPMPESVRNRCTKAHEYVFLLTKGQRYYCDMEAIREDVKPSSGQRMRSSPHGDGVLERGHRDQIERTYDRICGANKRSVWSVSSQGYPGAHFATFPPKLIEPCIKAGTSEKGCCALCGSPRKRIVESVGSDRVERESKTDMSFKPNGNPSQVHRPNGTEYNVFRAENPVKTVGWEPTCECNGKFVKRTGTRLGYGSYHDHEMDGVEYGLRQNGRRTASVPGEPTKELKATWMEYVSDLPPEDHPVMPCTVLDPFVGSGTTCCVSFLLGRRSIGIDLSEEYLRVNAIPRVEGAVLSVPGKAWLVGRKVEAMNDSVGERLGVDDEREAEEAAGESGDG